LQTHFQSRSKGASGKITASSPTFQDKGFSLLILELDDEDHTHSRFFQEAVHVFGEDALADMLDRADLPQTQITPMSGKDVQDKAAKSTEGRVENESQGRW
jgi:hypothetical protein